MSEHSIKIKRRIRNIQNIPASLTSGGSALSSSKKMRTGHRYGEFRTLEEMEQECQERCEAAYRFGFDDGKKIGLQEGRDEVKQSVAYLKDKADKLMEKRDAIFGSAEGIIVQLALAVAKTILRREAKTDVTLVKTLAKESLRLVEDKRRVSIKVNPTDLNAIQGFEEEILSTAPGVKEWEIRQDDRVTAGGCIIETEAGIVDAQLETQLDEIGATLMEAV